MKLHIRRETAIGLSVLLLLLVILGGVAVHRFMRPNVPPEVMLAKAEERIVEESLDHHSQREGDLFPKPAMQTPTDAPNHDRLHPLDEPGQWNTASKETKETRKERPTSSPALGLIASETTATSSPPVSDKPHRRDGERTATPTELQPDAPEDRYSPSAPSAEHRTKGGSEAAIQLSGGEAADGAPRTLERYPADRRAQPVRPEPGTAAMDAMPRVPEVPESHPRHDGPVAGMPVESEAARRQAEKARAHEFQVAGAPVDVDAARGGYSAGSYSGPPPGSLRSNYSMAPGGYAPDNALRSGGGEFPGAMPAQNPLRGDGKYEVQPNDSYWTISERVYGHGAYFRALAEENRGKAARPDRLPPGLVISTPAVAQLEKDYPDLCPRPNHRETLRSRAESRPASGYPGNPGASMVSTAGGGRTYIVQEGDTLSSIARNELGKVSRWAEIYQINREALGKDYDYLTPGMRLVLPIRDSQPGDRTTRRSDSLPLMR